MSEYHEYMAPEPLSAEEVALLHDFFSRLREAERKHPQFAEGMYHGLGIVSEEHGELVKAATKEEGEERVHDEALDLLTVTWRFARGDWK